MIVKINGKPIETLYVSEISKFETVKSMSIAGLTIIAFCIVAYSLFPELETLFAGLVEKYALLPIPAANPIPVILK